MITDMYNDFHNKHFKYYCDHKRTPKEQWYYGNTAQLIFNICDYVEEDKDTYSLNLTFENFRHEEILTVEGLEYSSTVEYIVDSETSKKYFPRGVYYCKMDSINVETGDVTTILSEDDCFLYVK